jgi:hypothetical protein
MGNSQNKSKNKRSTPGIKAVQLADTYWLYVVWNPLDKPDATPLIIQNPAKHLDHAKKEIVAARYFDIPAAAVEEAARKGKDTN